MSRLSPKEENASQSLSSNIETTPKDSTPIHTRQVTNTDKEGWVTIWNIYGSASDKLVASDITDQVFNKFLDEGTQMWSAIALKHDKVDNQEEIVGFVTYLGHPSTKSIQNVIYIQDLYVREDARNNSAGRKLMEFVIQDAKMKNASKVYWRTPEDNSAANKLYSKLAKRTNFVHYVKNLID